MFDLLGSSGTVTVQKLTINTVIYGKKDNETKINKEIIFQL